LNSDVIFLASAAERFLESNLPSTDLMLLFWSVESALEDRALGVALSVAFALREPMVDIKFSFVKN
jgi:hypothetical protein